MRYSMTALLFVALITIGCSDDVPTAVSIKSATTLATAKVSAIGNLVSDEDARSAQPSRAALADSFDLLRATGINAVWTTDPGPASLKGGSDTNSLQLWFERMFDVDFQNSNESKVTFAGRVSGALDVFCYIGEMGIATDSSGLPSVGTYTVTLPASIVTNCGASSDTAGLEITMEVTATTDTTLYDKLFSVNLGNECPFKFLARANSSDINIATAEDQSCDGRDQSSQTIFRYNAATQVSRFTYISQAFSSNEATAGHEFYRGFLDESADEAYILGHYGTATNANSITGQNGVSFTAAGKPTAGGTVALSVRSAGGGIANGEYNGCISISDSSVATDNSLTCTITGTDISTAYTVVTSVHGEHTAIADLYGIGATTNIDFTSKTDIYTYTAR